MAAHNESSQEGREKNHLTVIKKSGKFLGSLPGEGGGRDKSQMMKNFFLIVVLLLYWGYIVTLTKVLTLYFG
jgi:hypothetical protein